VVDDAPVTVTNHLDVETTYRAESAKLWRAVFAFAGNRAIADDAVAEAFAQALRREKSIRSLRPWVWRAAFRIAAGELKDARLRTAWTDGSFTEHPEDSIDLLRALAGLSPKQRASILLFHYGGLSVKEAAAAIGSTPGATRVHLSLGRRRLRVLMEGDDDA